MDYRIIIPVMHCFDDRYTAPAAVAFLSMLEHGAKDCFFKLYVAHRDITEKHQTMLQEVVTKFPNASLEFFTPGSKVDEEFERLKFKGHFSKEVLFKLMVADHFTQYDRLMIADVDVLYKDDISKLFERTLADDNYVVGHSGREAPISWGARYREESYGNDFTEDERNVIRNGINGCLLIFNLKAMRRDGVAARMVKYLHENGWRLKQAEQDVINFVCASKISYFPLRAVVCVYLWSVLTKDEERLWREAMDNPIQVHYSLPEKPWINPAQQMAHLWWRYVTDTPFFYEVAQKFSLQRRKSNWSFLGKIPFLEIWSTGTITKVKLARIFNLKPTIPFWRKK